MFTGIIQSTGTIKELTESQIVIQAPSLISDLKKGGSVAVDGVCLTVIELLSDSFSADFMPETAQKTIIENYKEGSLVNLELPMRPQDRFEGHIVTGHVEARGEVLDIQADGNVLTIQLPTELDRYIVPKGSITLNGISLTVADVKNGQFTVSIIPHTWKETNLHTLNNGDKVNVETDILAKHIEKLQTQSS